MRRRHRTSLLSALVLALLGASCRSESSSSSSSLAFSDDATRLWVTSPDDDALVSLDAETLEERRRIEVEGAPQQLVIDGEGRLWVSLEQASEVAVVDEEGGVTRAAVPCGGTAGLAVVGSDPPRIAVACPNDDRVVLLDDDGGVLAVVDVPGRPETLAARGAVLWVGASRAGALYSLDAGAIARDGSTLQLGDVQRSAVQLEPSAGVAAIQLVATSGPAGGDPVFAYQRVSHDEDRDRPPALGGYGSVVDDEPRIAPRLYGACGGSYARFDGGARVASGPSALAYAPATDTLWIAHLYTDNVVVLRCGSSPAGELAAVFTLGRGPRGIVVAENGKSAFVDVGFDHALARLELPDENRALPLSAAKVQRRALGPVRLSDEARSGRSLFFDAVDTHLTPSGVVTCGTCHPHGGDDGLTWFLHTTNVPRKLRRTPPAWSARDGLAPFHWDGEFADAPTLIEGTIKELMEGDALLVDTSAIAAYLGERAPPFPRPIVDENAVERGRALFESDAVGCAACHEGALYGGGEMARVTPASEDPDEHLDEASVPPLVGVRARAPYLHDGRARDLTSLFEEHNPDDTHGATQALTDDELRDLVAFLESL